MTYIVTTVTTMTKYGMNPPPKKHTHTHNFLRCQKAIVQAGIVKTNITPQKLYTLGCFYEGGVGS